MGSTFAELLHREGLNYHSKKRLLDRAIVMRDGTFFILLLRTDRLNTKPEVRCPICDDPRMNWERDDDRQLWLTCQLCGHHLARGVRFRPKVAR